MIDYDRLTLDTDAQDYYVSFDNEAVGKLQGEGLVDCVGNKQGAQVAVLNGSPTDNNATLFKNGYDSVIDTKFESGEWKKIDDQSVPDWDNQKALTIFEQMLQANNNKVDGVLAANDGLGNAAISALKQRKLPQVPVTGQDATLEGIQNIVNGDQCMTVYKAIKKEADAAAKLAIALAKGEKPTRRPVPIDNGTQEGPVGAARRRSSVTKDNIKDYLGEPDFPKQGGDLRREARLEVRGGRPLEPIAVGPGRLGRPGHPPATRGGCGERQPGSGAARGLEALRRGPGPARGGLPREPRRGDGARGRQRRRQVDADQVRRRHPPHRRGRDPLRGRAR